MSVVSYSRDLASGLTAALGGRIVVQKSNGHLLHFERLGWIAIGVSILSLWIYRQVKSVEQRRDSVG